MTAEEQIQKLTAERDAALEACRVAGIGAYKGDYFLGRLTETGQLRQERDAALRQVAEMRERMRRINDGLSTACEMIETLPASEWQTSLIVKVSGAFHEANWTLYGTNTIDCGKGYVKAESLRCFKCGDGYTPLYCLNCAREGYHHDDEWRPVVEALDRIYRNALIADGVNVQHVDTIWLRQECAKALAHAEKLTKQ